MGHRIFRATSKDTIVVDTRLYVLSNPIECTQSEPKCKLHGLWVIMMTSVATNGGVGDVNSEGACLGSWLGVSGGYIGTLLNFAVNLKL